MIIEQINESLPGVVLEQNDFRGDQTILIHPSRLLELVKFIYDYGFQMLLDVTAVDFPERYQRFEVVYHFLNLTSQTRLRVKLRVKEGESVQSLTAVFNSANWSEREVEDLFGIHFDGHPNPKRLLMWDDYEGYPLRKDFPLDGGDIFCNDLGASFAGQSKSLFTEGEDSGEQK